jgi:predicted CopG family antitoxin
MKTVSFDDEAYEILRGLKTSPKESFSDVVKKHFGRRKGLDASFGGWAEKSPEELARLARETEDAFGWTTADGSRPPRKGARG